MHTVEYVVKYRIGNYTVPFGCGHKHRSASAAEACRDRLERQHQGRPDFYPGRPYVDRREFAGGEFS